MSKEILEFPISYVIGYREVPPMSDIRYCTDSYISILGGFIGFVIKLDVPTMILKETKYYFIFFVFLEFFFVSSLRTR